MSPASTFIKIFLCTSPHAYPFILRYMYTWRERKKKRTKGPARSPSLSSYLARIIILMHYHSCQIVRVNILNVLEPLKKVRYTQTSVTSQLYTYAVGFIYTYIFLILMQTCIYWICMNARFQFFREFLSI